MKETWEKRNVPLSFRLGEVTLAKPTIRLLVNTLHFTELKSPALPELPAGVRGALIPSFPVEARKPRLRLREGRLRYVFSQYERFFVDLEQTPDDYLAAFSSKSRSTLKRKVKKFAKLCGGEIDWREYGTPEEMEDYYRMARSVSEKTYQERLLDVGLPAGEGFREEMQRLAERGEVRGYLLFHEEKPVAYFYTPVRDGIVRYEYLGYDPEYGKHSPGVVLQWLLLEKLFVDEKARLFDFLEGETQHKSFFSTGSRLCADLYYFKPSSFALVFSHMTVERLSAGIGFVLEKLGIKSAIRKLIRRWKS